MRRFLAAVTGQALALFAQFITAVRADWKGVEPVPLSNTDIADLVAFLEALTGETATAPRPLGRPDAVPSGLPVD